MIYLSDVTTYDKPIRNSDLRGLIYRGDIRNLTTVSSALRWEVAPKFITEKRCEYCGQVIEEEK